MNYKNFIKEQFENTIVKVIVVTLALAVLGLVGGLLN